jgi:hypothetical protein
MVGLKILLVAGLVFIQSLSHACPPVLKPALLSKEWPRDKYFFLYQPGSDKKQNEDFARILEKSKFKWFQSTNLTLVTLPEKGKSPSLVLMSPRGRNIKNLKKEILLKDMEKLFVSRARENIAKAYNEKTLLVIIHWESDNREYNKHNARVIQAVCRQFSVMNNNNIGVVKVNLSDRGEGILKTCLNLELKELTPAVTLLLWNAKPAVTLYDKIDKESFFKYIQDTFEMATKTVMPHDYGENILMFWPNR